MTQSADEDDRSSGDDARTEVVRWRAGRLTAIFVVIIGAGLIVNAVFFDDQPTAARDTPAETDVANFPTGALAGEPAPEALFPLFDGTTFSMADHVATDGRPLVLNFWASWCFPCRAEMPEFSELADLNPDVAFVGVAIDDSRGPAEMFADEIAVSYPLGIDEDRAVADNYPFVGLPTTYLIGPDGVVTRQIQGQVTGGLLQAFIDFDFGS